MKAQIRKAERYCTLVSTRGEPWTQDRMKDKMPQTFATACNGLKRQVSF